MNRNIFCTLKEEKLNFRLNDNTQNILVELPDVDAQKINCTLKDSILNFRFSPIETAIRVNIEGGLKGEEGHTHANKEMLDSLRYDVHYQCYVIRNN